MKKITPLTAILFCLLASFTHADENYKNGNGTLIYKNSSDEKNIEVRKLEMKNVEIGDFLSDKNTIYKTYEKGEPVGKLNIWDEKTMDIHEMCAIKVIDKKASRYNQKGEIWLKISVSAISGWLCLDDKWYNNPYEYSNYEFLETMHSGNKNWNIRKLNQWISVWTNLNIRDKPGLSGNKVSMIKYEGPQLNYEVFAITEETETIDGINDHWVKIKYDEDKYGWVFGGYVSVERGGPKYEIPEAEIEFLVGWQP